MFYRGKFKDYAFDHQSFEKRKELYVLKFGPPKCPTCEGDAGFKRGVPKKFCSFVCQGKQNGFSKPSTQERVREVVKEKYGVDNVLQLPHAREAAVKAAKNRIYVPSEETKAKQSLMSKQRWNDPVLRARMTASLKEACNKPEERERRSKFAKQQMNNAEHVRLFFGPGSGHFSKLHQRIREELQLGQFGFVSEQYVNPYIADELHPSKAVVIEINGDYIHANPKKYKATDVIRIPGHVYTAQEKWDRDQRKIDYLQSKGYKVYVIWESDDMEKWKELVKNNCINHRPTVSQSAQLGILHTPNNPRSKPAI